VKAITWDEICRRRESIDAYSPIDALGTENRLPFRSRSSTIGVHQPLIRRARSHRQQRLGTFNAKRARFWTFKMNLGDQSQLKLVQLLGRNKRLRLAGRVKFWMGSGGGSGPGGGSHGPQSSSLELARDFVWRLGIKVFSSILWYQQNWQFFRKISRIYTLKRKFPKISQFFWVSKNQNIILWRKKHAWDACVFSSLLPNLFRYYVVRI
jgi:hypothetical protein